MRPHRAAGTLLFLVGAMSNKAGFAWVQLCCRVASTRASFLHYPSVHLSTAPPRGGGGGGGGFLLGRSTTPRGSGRNIRSRAATIGTASALSGSRRHTSAASATGAAAGRAAGTSTTAAILAAALLLSSSPSPAAARFGGWRTGQRRGAHATPSMTASALTSDASAVGGLSVERAAGAAAGHVGGGDAETKPPVVFVLGGPGSGKGTQCERLAKEYGYVHLSAGELLRQERASGSSDGQLIDEYIREGRIVPVAISLALLRKAMEASGPLSRFLIDGFPRNQDNVEGWDAIMGDVADVRCVLFLFCPEEVLEQRLLSRGKSSGRSDDNAETAKRRFQTYVDTTLPVVEQYERQGLVARVDGNQDIEAVFRDVVSGLKPVQEKEVLDANRLAVHAVCAGDRSAYAELCAPEMTELLGGGLTAVPHDGKAVSQALTDAATPPSMSRPQVRILKGGAAAVVSCERPRGAGLTGGGSTAVVQETRLWEMQGGRWKCVHCHVSPR